MWGAISNFFSGLLGSGAASGAGAAAGGAAANAAAGAASSGLASGIGSILGGAGSLLGAGASIYGAKKQSKLAKQELDFQKRMYNDWNSVRAGNELNMAQGYKDALGQAEKERRKKVNELNGGMLGSGIY